nr:galactose-1-epimerase [Rhizobium sp.]
MTRRNFGVMPTGETVEQVVLTGGGLTASILTFGAVLQDLRLDGHERPLVL